MLFNVSTQKKGREVNMTRKIKYIPRTFQRCQCISIDLDTARFIILSGSFTSIGYWEFFTGLIYPVQSN